MVSYGHAYGKAQDPCARRRFRIIIINASVSRIPAVKCGAGGIVCTFVRREVYLTVTDCSKGARLIYHSGDGVGERGMLHSVQYYRSYGHLTHVRFPPGLAVNSPGK